jgi:D-glycero-D-manno-heptose 1,7-bisphosphate phosphatase
MYQPTRRCEHPLNSDGVWCQIFAQMARDRPALFLDRDGTVIEEGRYLSRAEDITIIPGAAEVIAAANKRGIPVVMVTNQAGIGRGYYGWSEFKAVQNALVAALVDKGAVLNAVYACAHHPQANGSFAHPDHPARKPNPGMLLQAGSDFGLDLKSSWLVGDKAIDVEAAKRAGIAGALQVATGYGLAQRQLAAELAGPNFEVRFGDWIPDAMVLPILIPQNIK